MHDRAIIETVFWFNFLVYSTAVILDEHEPSQYQEFLHYSPY